MKVQDLFNNLTDEQKEKALACKTPEELAALTRSAGMALSDDQLEAVSGGGSGCDDCPFLNGGPRGCTSYCTANNTGDVRPDFESSMVPAQFRHGAFDPRRIFGAAERK